MTFLENIGVSREESKSRTFSLEDGIKEKLLEKSKIYWSDYFKKNGSPLNSRFGNNS